VLKLDIQGYFMSISRELLYRKMEALLLKYAGRKNENGVKWKETINMERVLYLLKEIIYNDPTDQCRIKGAKQDWEGLPPSKSLFYSPTGCGLPIGNLTSQVFSNIYLNDFDHYVKRTLGMQRYGRYVDDFYIVHDDKDMLKSLLQPITRYLWDELQLSLHPNKIVLQNAVKGVNFLGAHIKPYRDYPVNRTRKTICKSVCQLEHYAKNVKVWDKQTEYKVMASMNSYLGYLKQFQTYGLRRKLTNQCQAIQEKERQRAAARC